MTRLSAFSQSEEAFLQKLYPRLKQLSPPLHKAATGRHQDLDMLAGIVRRAPSLSKDLGIGSEKRNTGSMSCALFENSLGAIHRIPTKAAVGYSFSISKLHFYGLIRRLVAKYPGELDEFGREADRRYSKLLFLLMAEELYEHMLSKGIENRPWNVHVSEQLIRLWEFRSSDEPVDFAPFIRKLWNARKQVTPTLGTLMGSVELLCLSFQLPAIWSDFLTRELGDQARNEALEEFLFDLSFEELSYLRKEMKQKKIHAVSRQEAHRILSRQSETDSSGIEEHELPSLALYRSFLRRKQDANRRAWAMLEGPRKTIEEYFVEYFYTAASVQPDTAERQEEAISGSGYSDCHEAYQEDCPAPNGKESSTAQQSEPHSSH